jgi:CTP synthase
MIAAIKWAREKKVPFLGICLGFQVACIEWARNVCGMEGRCLESPPARGYSLTASSCSDAHSAELLPNTPHPTIVFMPEISKTHLGGTMRLGLRPTVFDKGTEKCKIRRLYGGEDPIWERHRHRYEVNPEYVERLEAPGKFRFIGKDERGERMQVLEMEGMFQT